MMPFVGTASFLKGFGTPPKPYGFLGVPFDGAASFHPGARFGPNAIRAASMMLTDGDHPDAGNNPCLLCSDLGDVEVNPSNIEGSLAAIADRVELASTNQTLLIAGGDHTITLGILRGLHRRLGSALACIHLDAHCDTWEGHFGMPTGHGTWMRQAVEEGLVRPQSTISAGMRSPVDRATKAWLGSKGGQSWQMNVIPQQAQTFAEHIAMSCGGLRTYLSVDIDVLDPAFAPGTGTPEIGGMTSAYLRELVFRLAGLCDIVAMDVVEVCPSRDVSDKTALAAATIMYDFIAAHAARREDTP